MSDEDRDYWKRMFHQLALKQLRFIFYYEKVEAEYAFENFQTPADERWVHEATMLNEVVEDNISLEYGDPRQYRDLPHMITAITGVIALDHVGKAIIDEDRVLLSTRRRLIGNLTFQRIANERYFEDNYGVTLPFTLDNQVESSHISALTPAMASSSRFR